LIFPLNIVIFHRFLGQKKPGRVVSAAARAAILLRMATGSSAEGSGIPRFLPGAWQLETMGVPTGEYPAW